MKRIIVIEESHSGDDLAVVIVQDDLGNVRLTLQRFGDQAEAHAESMSEIEARNLATALNEVVDEAEEARRGGK